MVFRINPNEPLGAQVTKAKTGEYATYEVRKGKNGTDFTINGPAGTGTELDYPFTVGDILILEDAYQIEFEDGFNRKSIVDTNKDPFSNEISNDLFTETDGNTENNNDTEGNPFA
jgi:GTPase involved in cell partitioning and DNA repair